MNVRQQIREVSVRAALRASEEYGELAAAYRGARELNDLRRFGVLNTLEALRIGFPGFGGMTPGAESLQRILDVLDAEIERVRSACALCGRTPHLHDCAANECTCCDPPGEEEGAP